jgi:hypothetical protein
MMRTRTNGSLIGALFVGLLAGSAAWSSEVSPLLIDLAFLLFALGLVVVVTLFHGIRPTREEWAQFPALCGWIAIFVGFSEIVNSVLRILSAGWDNLF